MGMYTATKRMDGKTVVVTGGNGGIGYETAKDLARRGAKVVLACRSKERGSKAVKDIIKASGNKQIELMELDLSSFQSVRDFAKEASRTLEKIDILVNNAGVPPQEGISFSKDKYDLVLQTNHFSHFLLTHLLKDLLSKSDSPRIVNVGSAAQRKIGPPSDPPGTIDYATIKQNQAYQVEYTYGASKFMNSLFTQEIARRWGGEGFKSYSLHPGVVRTEIFNKTQMPPWFVKLNPVLQKFVLGLTVVLVFIFGKSPVQGAQTSVFCCLEDGLKNGEYYADCRLSPWYVRSPAMYNAEMAEKLWDFSNDIVKL